MKSKVLFSGVVMVLAGCASSGVIPTGADTFMVSKTSAGGVFVSGSSVKADLYIEANKFCSDRGQVVETVDASSKNAVPFARMPSAQLQFKCVPRVPLATSAASTG